MEDYPIKCRHTLSLSSIHQETDNFTNAKQTTKFCLVFCEMHFGEMCVKLVEFTHKIKAKEKMETENVHRAWSQ